MANAYLPENEKLAELLFPQVQETIDQLMARYPKRQLPEGAKVTRVAPSPTGFVHLGTYYQALIDERLAHCGADGIFYIRLEDTDAKREVAGAAGAIPSVLRSFGIEADEGVTADGEQGDYGPYFQSKRGEIYHVFAKELVLRGRAYPCFCSEEQLAEMRRTQEEKKDNFGYYGAYARCRRLTLSEIEEKLAAGQPYVLRFRSDGDREHKLKFTDVMRGAMELSENDMDHVLLKSDGIPTYHFAHVCDDTLMGTTHVVRGEEWLSSLPFHLQLFAALDIKPPKYLHTATIMKMDGEGKRKLSKRKDPEAGMSRYVEWGYPKESLREYILTLMNSNYEEWRAANPEKSHTEFPFSAKKMSISGCLFDQVKLDDISKNVIARMDKETVYAAVSSWAKDFDRPLYDCLSADPEKAKAIFAIGRGGKKPRKDLARWDEVKAAISFFYPSLYCPAQDYDSRFQAAQIKEILSDYRQCYTLETDNSSWFETVKALAARHGFCPDMKAYKAAPEDFPGHVGDVSGFVRMAVTGRANSPDLFTVMQILGRAETDRRLEQAIAAL